jgi:hypothetical protein
VPVDYAVDFLLQILVIEVASYEVVSLREDQTLAEIRTGSPKGAPGRAHHGVPLADAELGPVGLVNRRDLLEPGKPATTRASEINRGPFEVAFEATTFTASDLDGARKVGPPPSGEA